MIYEAKLQNSLMSMSKGEAVSDDETINRGKADPKIPRNKILIAFATENNRLSSHRKDVVQTLFKVNDIEEEQKILKSLIWKNKYYDCEFDLYIDDFNNIDDWLSELNTEECDELRNVLAGVIIVDAYRPNSSNDSDMLREFAKSKTRNTFNIWCNTNKSTAQELIDYANEQLVEENLNAEIINWHSEGSINQYGEKIGFERMKEIIDTHEWEFCESVMRLQKKVASTGTMQPRVEDQTCDTLQHMVETLQNARLQYHNSDYSAEEASDAAFQLAEEIAKLLK